MIKIIILLSYIGVGTYIYKNSSVHKTGPRRQIGWIRWLMAVLWPATLITVLILCLVQPDGIEIKRYDEGGPEE